MLGTVGIVTICTTGPPPPVGDPVEFHHPCLSAVLRIRDVYPGSLFFFIPDPGSASKNLSTYFNPKN
jgi:hypothetical protein